ncbi:chromosome segregation protein ScpA [Sinomonas atrocyanea]|uniref:Segregation and condensation protein A n=1 Tax=Sinomonas atrocyanea TaxID=37927 RepID=A0A127A002_9MICC|nr:segregation/condensation protein A [Sinomonas atrocyanea]AMM32446.1 chromosome segregation protein ScpA [Sinomonas atrocyanea]GEB63561.1 segregation/condensation protein A [Sinomonas atrocyanea]GGG60067.1 segregation/condensation protein A [Sinomonas atrocyanea]
MELPDPEPADAAPGAGGFEVRLENFTGPFDLLLGLIAKHRLDITEVALATVTDDFIAYTRALQAKGEDWALDEASEFLVIAATLLDLKAARLLPQGAVEDEEDVARLEARDLLFARLLQYRAFKEIAGIFAATLDAEARRFPRSVTLEPAFAALLPELVWRHTPEQFAALAAKAFAPKEAPPSEVGTEHLHAPPVSVREQAELIGLRLQGSGPLSFRALTADAESRLVVVARFLALLELFRDRAVAFEQAAPLAELSVRWTAGGDWSAERVSEEYEDASDREGQHAAG